jgi:PAS domain S-box-containing protein
MLNAITQDITGLQLKDSFQVRLSLIGKIAEIGDWILDLQTNKAVCSDYIYEFFKLDRSYDWMSMLDQEGYYRGEQFQKMKALLQIAIDTRSQCQDEFSVVMPDGKVKWHATTMVPILDEDGNVVAVHGVLQNITQRKQLEEKEKKDKQFYNYIFENLPTQLVVLNDSGRYIYVNRQAIKNDDLRSKIIGMNNTEYCEMRNWDLSIGKRRDRYVCDCIEMKKPVFFEEAMLDPNGVERHYIRTMHPLFDEKGEVELVVGYGMDVTELKQVKDINSKQHQAIETSMDGVALLDNAGAYYYMNQSHARMFGYSGPDELIGKTWQVIYPEDEVDRISKHLFPLLIQNGYWSGETLGMKKDGTLVYQEITLTALPNGELICICRDITERKMGELQLKRMAVVAEKTNSIVIISDPSRKMQWVNDSFTRILGYEKEEVIGKDPGIVLQGPETSPETVRQIVQSLRNSGSFSGEILNYTKKGEKIWLYVDIAAVYDDQGKLINYIAIENDITPMKEAEERLKKAVDKERELNRFKTQFINLASHQFRTPLATIRSSIDVLELKSGDTDMSEFIKVFNRHKQIMTEETLRMTELMENILDIGRMDEGRVEIAKKQLSFKVFMDDFVRANQEIHGQKRKLIYSFDADDRNVLLDEILIRNVLRNVVSNAFKYSVGKASPELRVIPDVNGFKVIITDHGVGIPYEDQSFLFQSFYRASNVKAYPGTGLGLMIAKKLIELHGGSIQLESNPGSGCSVTITISSN